MSKIVLPPLPQHHSEDWWTDAITALREALAAPMPEPVHQFRQPGCSDWYDGTPDHHDGHGPYEVRTLYAAPPAAPAPVVPATFVVPGFAQWRDGSAAPVVPSQHIIGYVSPRELEPGPKHGSTVDVYREQMAGGVPVSAAPVVREPLTDEQIDRIRLETREWHILGYLTAIRFARAIEAHHGIGGGGK